MVTVNGEAFVGLVSPDEMVVVGPELSRVSAAMSMEFPPSEHPAAPSTRKTGSTRKWKIHLIKFALSFNVPQTANKSSIIIRLLLLEFGQRFDMTDKLMKY